MKLALFIVFFIVVKSTFSQEDEKIYISIELDTLTIFARNEFDTKTFIQRIKDDTTFYQAFKNLKYYPHKALGDLWVYNKKNKEKASEKIVATQYLDNNLMWQEQKITASTGRLRTRKEKFRFVTAEMYYNTFFPKDTTPVSTTMTKVKDEYYGKGKRAKYKHDLKLMMFNPGEDISGIPIVGKKMSIFDDDMIEFYDYKVSIIAYNGISCYQFSCIAKPEFRNHKTVVKNLVTIFDKETMAVLSREYEMQYKSIFFQFDVKIHVKNEVRNGVIYPLSIEYDGYWNVPLKTQETIRFTIKNSDYSLTS